MTPHYAVFGQPIRHSKSPLIHHAFAQQLGITLQYDAIELPADDFNLCLSYFAKAEFLGANVTVPFKEQAFALCAQLSPEARKAGAVNTLSKMADGQLHGHNTDGLGLVADLSQNLLLPLRDRWLLLLGAGGAARGVIGPLLAAGARITLANRSRDKAQQLAQHFSDLGSIDACSFDQLTAGPSLVINATSASLAGQALPLPDRLWTGVEACYDMMYGATPTAFNQQAQAKGVMARHDGLGMLVEQAAQAFAHWHGQQPNTAHVLQQLRQQLQAS